MKVSELKAGSTLDSLVALAQGWIKGNLAGNSNWPSYWSKDDQPVVKLGLYQPSFDTDTGKAQAFKLIEGFKLELVIGEDDWWAGRCWHPRAEKPARYAGLTPAEAICKAVVASKWGDEIPDDVMEKVNE